jgi:hypothetical protein
MKVSKKKKAERMKQSEAPLPDPVVSETPPIPDVITGIEVIEEPLRKFQVLLADLYSGAVGYGQPVMAKDLEEVKEKIKPAVLLGAFVVLGNTEEKK